MSSLRRLALAGLGDLDEAALSSHKHDGRDKPGHDAVDL
jgi:hypothetical protein